MKTEINSETLEKILHTLHEIVGGNTSLRLPISKRRDGLDAISYAINSLVQELTFLKEKAEAASQAKSRFLAIISHEIRTPVTVIKGFSEHLANPHLSGADREAANGRVSSNCKVLLELIDEILDLSKVEEGKLKIIKQKFSLLTFLNGMINDTAQAAHAKGLRLQLFISSIGLDEIETDQMRLRQILNNIIGNAIKFTDEGSVEVKISTEELYKRMVLKVEVSDTGVGISKEYRKNLFQPFSQLNQDHARTHDGTGLGLVLSKRLAQLLGGDVELLKSEVGKGTTFIIRIDGGPLSISERGNKPRNMKPLKQNRCLKKMLSKELKFYWQKII